MLGEKLKVWEMTENEVPVKGYVGRMIQGLYRDVLSSWWKVKLKRNLRSDRVLYGSCSAKV